ncbi:MAG: hypothetical protein IPL34_20450 [Thiofilum sp.]|uniref:hypothetical protein n=1 Tax=Thiofilum sp. TaxID=2212733 RepID=UPI0025F05FD0|nr:hypothetical protein [Thiofilum sp.]MBK8455654.1 hypothetical protein [Thiofilum sp.]
MADLLNTPGLTPSGTFKDTPYTPTEGVPMTSGSQEFAPYYGPGSWGEMFRARAYEQLVEKGPTSSLFRWSTEQFINQIQPKVSADDLNKTYADMADKGVFFTEPMAPSVARLRVEQRRKEYELNQWMARGQSKWGWGSEMLAGMAQSLDPINIAVGAGVGMLAGPILPALRGIKRTAGLIALETAGNLAVDVPTYMQLKREFTDQGIFETAIGSVGGGILQGSIGGLFKPKVLNTIQKIEAQKDINILSHSPEQTKQLVADTINSIEAGTSVEFANIRYQQLIGAELQQPHVPYKDITHPSQTPFYGAEGGSLTDSPYLANNKGNFKEFQIAEDAVVLDPRATIKDNESSKFALNTIRKALGYDESVIESLKNTKAVEQGLSLDEYIDSVNITRELDGDELLDKATLFKEVAQEQGMDAVMTTYERGGRKIHTQLEVLNPEKVAPVQDWLHNPDIKDSRLPKLEPMDSARTEAEAQKMALEVMDASPKIAKLKPEQVAVIVKERAASSVAEFKALITKLRSDEYYLAQTWGEFETKYKDIFTRAPIGVRQRLKDLDIVRDMETAAAEATRVEALRDVIPDYAKGTFVELTEKYGRATAKVIDDLRNNIQDMHFERVTGETVSAIGRKSMLAPGASLRNLYDFRGKTDFTKEFGAEWGPKIQSIMDDLVQLETRQLEVITTPKAKVDPKVEAIVGAKADYYDEAMPPAAAPPPVEFEAFVPQVEVPKSRYVTPDGKEIEVPKISPTHKAAIEEVIVKSEEMAAVAKRQEIDTKKINKVLLKLLECTAGAQ